MVQFDGKHAFEPRPADSKLPTRRGLDHRVFGRRHVVLLHELLTVMPIEREPLPKDRAHIVLLSEDHVVGKSHSVPVAFAHVEVESQHHVLDVLPLRIFDELAGVEISLPYELRFRVGPAEVDVGITEVFASKWSVTVLRLRALMEELEV